MNYYLPELINKIFPFDHIIKFGYVYFDESILQRKAIAKAHTQFEKGNE